MKMKFSKSDSDTRYSHWQMNHIKQEAHFKIYYTCQQALPSEEPSTSSNPVQSAASKLPAV